jgi:RIO kinase 1
MRMSADIVSRNEIETFFSEGWIDEVLFTVKSGKEATVYCCKAAPGRGEFHFALKVYKERQYRNFRNMALYQEGRLQGVGARVVRAFHNKSRFGREVERVDWLGNEFGLLRRLFEAGAAVPRPFAMAGNALLLAFIGEQGRPAPQLVTLRLTPVEAEALLEQALTNIEIMLAHHIVHGDLSAYNLLVADGRLALIDFPQAIDARTNPNAKALLVRDVRNVCRYFAAQGADAEPGNYAEELWDLYARAK